MNSRKSWFRSDTQIVRILLKRIAPMLLTIAGLLVSILIIEICLRVFRYKPELERDFYLTCTWRVLNKETVMINPKFLKDNFYTSGDYDKTILTLGDSFTEGYPVGKGKTYPDVLRELLRIVGCRINVVNVGQGDSGTDQHLKLFTKYILPKLKPDVVIWSIYPNDIWDNIEKAVYTISDSNRLIPMDGSKSWLYRRQLIYDWFPLPASMKQESYLLNILLKSTEILKSWQVPQEYKDKSEEWGLKKIQLAVEEMNRLALIHGFELYYVLIAPQAVYLEESNPQDWKNYRTLIFYNRIEAMLRDRVDFISARFDNPYLQFETKAENAMETHDIFADGKRDKNSIGNRHLNEIGYRLLARKVLKHLSLRWGVSGSAKPSKRRHE